MIPQAMTEHQERSTEHRAPGTGGNSIGESWDPSTEEHREPRTECPVSSGQEGWLWPVPIVEVGTWVRTRDNQRGIVRDVEDVDGILMYLVQLDGRARMLRIPARTLKGVHL